MLDIMKLCNEKINNIDIDITVKTECNKVEDAEPKSNVCERKPISLTKPEDKEEDQAISMISSDDQQRQKNLAMANEALDQQVKAYDALLKVVDDRDKTIDTLINQYNTNVRIKDYEIDELRSSLRLWRSIAICVIFFDVIIRMIIKVVS